MSTSNRNLNYVDAIRESTEIEMTRDSNVVFFGLDVDDPKATFGTTKDLVPKFGAGRVFGTPLSEDAMTGVAVGLGLAGMRPIYNHYRMDFATLSMNQLINVAAKTHAMSGGEQHCPIVVKVLIGKSWGQGSQHSQSLYPLLMNIPGIKVCAPTTPYDIKGCLAYAVRDNNPVVIVEHRLCYFQNGPVPEGEYTVEPGRARVTVPGNDVTIVGISYQQIEAMRAAEYLKDVGVSAEVIDPIWLNPLDIDTIEASVRKTGRLIVVDNAWMQCGAGSEIIASLHERGVVFKTQRMGFAPTPCPTTPSLEKFFYPSAESIAAGANDLVKGSKQGWLPEERSDLKQVEFKGPF